MLHALAIYIQKDTGLLKEQSAQQDEDAPSGSMFFKPKEKPVTQLEVIEKSLHKEDKDTHLKFYETMEFDVTYEDERARSFDFVRKTKTKLGNAIFAISSKYDLEPVVKAFFFKNMEHILLRPELGASLDDILANPQGFIGMDLLIGRIHDKNKEIIAGMLKNFELVIKRGEDLEKLKEKAINLNESAIDFERGAKKLNSCCW